MQPLRWSGTICYYRNEKAEELKFALTVRLQVLLKKYGYPKDYLEGLIFIESKNAYDRSSACLRIAQKLRFPWSLFLHFGFTNIIPDLIYKVVASQRYRFFGAKDSCAVSRGEDTARFL